MGWGGRAAARVAMRKGRPESATAGRSSHSVRTPAPALVLSTPHHSLRAVPLLPAPPAPAPPSGRVFLLLVLPLVARRPRLTLCTFAQTRRESELLVRPTTTMPSRRRWTSRRRRRQVRRIAAATSTIGATMVGSGRRPRCVLFRLHKLRAVGLPAADFVVSRRHRMSRRGSGTGATTGSP